MGRTATVRRTILACALTGLLLGVIGAPTAQASRGRAPRVPPAATVGPLYFPSIFGLLPTLSLPHGCSASVVHSPAHDLVITAAHCVQGSGLGIEFVPGYHEGQMPYGIWGVARAYVDPAWLSSRDPQHDYAILQVARQGSRGIEDVVGANLLGSAPAFGTTVSVQGYATGSDDDLISCVTRTYDTAGYPSIDCPGFVNGTSGGPWVVRSQAKPTLVGLIGGLRQGGCIAATSYSPVFGADTALLLRRAAAGGPGDVVPAAEATSCPAA
ncbi:MAG: trypsin-like serine peptidase [Jatrophihabitantaceae bacterium]